MQHAEAAIRLDFEILPLSIEEEHGVLEPADQVDQHLLCETLRGLSKVCALLDFDGGRIHPQPDAVCRKAQAVSVREEERKQHGNGCNEDLNTDEDTGHTPQYGAFAPGAESRDRSVFGFRIHEVARQGPGSPESG